MNIVCGDPSKEPASYTRFVLPFAYKSYKPQRDLNHDAKDLHYEVIALEPDRVWRERYLTHEIADVLFRRVKWLRLMGGRSTIEVSIRFKDEYELLVTVRSSGR